MKLRRCILIVIQGICLTCSLSVYSQEPPSPGFPAPQENEVDHTAANEKLANAIQKAIDALNEIKNAAKIEILKKIKKHIEDNKKAEPGKNLDAAIKKAIAKGEATPQWLENLIKGWKKSMDITANPTDEGWKAIEPYLRLSRMMLRPIIYESGPATEPHQHAYLTFEWTSGEEPEYLNARLTDPYTGTSLWLVQNVPLLPFNESQTVSYVINVQAFGSGYDFLQCAYSVSSTWRTDPLFPVMGSVDLIPYPTLYNVGLGSADPTLSVGTFSIAPILPGPPKAVDFRYRGCDVPNEDLDDSKNYPDDNPIPNDWNACGPAAAANSLEWLKNQHAELAGDQTSLRSKVDSLKKYMNQSKYDTSGVRFDSFVVGKLTLIDKLKLPINVKYQSKHKSGNVAQPLASTEPPKHTADNQGELDVYPSFDWVKKEMEDGEDVELQLGWYGPVQDDGKRKRLGGHWVVVTGYFSNGMVKGIYIKADTDQANKGGTEQSYYEWAPGEIPCLVGMTDAAGNVAIIESAVSESYDQSVTFDDEPIHEHPYPWNKISLASVEAKIISIPAVPFVHESPVVPILTSLTSIGALIYFITQNEAPPCSFTATAHTTQPTCALPTGSIYIQTNPVTAYSFAWSHGAIDSIVTSLLPGQYVVTVTQVNTGCTQMLTASVDDQSAFTATATTQPADCGQQNGSATIQLTPQGTYTFAWSNGSTAQNQSGLAQGTYIVTITNSEACTSVTDVVIESTPFDPFISFTSLPASCGQSDGSIQVTATPSGNYDYNWSGGQSGDQITNLVAGTYTVTVSIPGSACLKTGETTLTELPPSFSLTTSTTPSSCGLADGTATVSVQPPGLYTTAWSDGQSTQQATALTPGSYSVTVTLQGTTCSQSTSVTIEQVPVSFTLTTTTTPAACGTSDGTATVFVDSEGAYSIVWSNGQTNAQATSLSAGLYSVTVTLNGTTCSQTTEVTIDELPPPFTLSSSSTPSDCGQANGSATINADPPGEYSYVWPGGQNTSTATGLASGIYEVTVTLSGSSCQQVTQVQVEQTPLTLAVFTSSTPAGCDVADGTASVDSIHGADAFAISMLWPDGQTGTTATGLVAGSYAVTITLQAAKCFAEYVDTVIVEQITPNFTGTINTVPADCGIANGSATAIIDPAGDYTFVWSNQQTGPQLQNVIAGTYHVTVTDANSCSESYSGEVPILMPEYSEIMPTTPANCLGGGDIQITLTTNGPGPLVVHVTHPGGTEMFVLNEGGHSLAELFNIVPGMFSLVVWDQSVGKACLDSAFVIIDDQTPALVPVDDQYTTPAETSLTGNVMSNDSGLNPTMTGIQNVIGGNVTFTSDGSFMFIPSPGFTGQASFVYTVTDACGTSGTALVTIAVVMVDCDFTIQTFITPAHCGLEDGAIQVEVNENGSYAYFWNTGDTDSELEDVAAGVYTVSITEVNLGCALEFELEVPEHPASYVDNVVIAQPSCSSAGEIQFTLTAPVPGDEFTMSISHPGGNDVFFADPGVIQLSDFIDIEAGFYEIEIFIGNPGQECVETFSAMINVAPMISIFEEAVFPPSSPPAMDGSAIVIVSPAGDAPYFIFVDGQPFGTSPGEIIQILGLGVGSYMVQVTDASGCESNTIIIVIPPPDDILSFGSGILNIPFDDTQIEHANSNVGWSNTIWTRVDFKTGSLPQRMQLLYSPTMLQSHPFIDLALTTRTKVLESKRMQFEMEGGFGIRPLWVEPKGLLSHYACLRATVDFNWNQDVIVNASFSVSGWQWIETPHWMITVALPFLNKRKL